MSQHALDRVLPELLEWNLTELSAVGSSLRPSSVTDPHEPLLALQFAKEIYS